MLHWLTIAYHVPDEGKSVVCRSFKVRAMDDSHLFQEIIQRKFKEQHVATPLFATNEFVYR